MVDKTTPPLFRESMKDLFGEEIEPESGLAAPLTPKEPEKAPNGKETGFKGHSWLVDVVIRPCSVVKEGLVTTIWNE